MSVCRCHSKRIAQQLGLKSERWPGALLWGRNHRTTANVLQSRSLNYCQQSFTRSIQLSLPKLATADEWHEIKGKSEEKKLSSRTTRGAYEQTFPSPASKRASSQARLKGVRLFIKRRDIRACPWWIQETQLYLLLRGFSFYPKLKKTFVPKSHSFDPSEKWNYTRAADSFRRTVQCGFIRPFPGLVSLIHFLTKILMDMKLSSFTHVSTEVSLAPCGTTAGHTRAGNNTVISDQIHCSWTLWP